METLRMSLRVLVVLLLLAFAAVGCANYNSIDRTSRLPSNDLDNDILHPAAAKAVHLDIKQRVLIAKEGDASSPDMVCAEPSPDALSAFASAASGGANAQGYGNAAAALAMSEAAGSVGLRTQSITLMRDALYRICEAYYNGQLTRADVKLLMTRNQDLTAAVVAIEQLTGAVVARQVGLGGGAASAASAALLANAEALAQARELEKKYDEELKAAIAARDARLKEQSDFEARYQAATAAEKATLEDEREAKQDKVNEAENLVKLKQQQFDDIKKAREAIETHQDSSVASASAATTSTAELSGGSAVLKVDKETAQAISTAVASIVGIVTTKCYAADQCMALLTDTKSTLDPSLQDTCLKLVIASIETAKKREEADRKDAVMQLDALRSRTSGQ
jgi:hypothetical protein